MLVKRERRESGTEYVTPLDTVVVFQMPGHRTRKPGAENTETFAHWEGIEMPAMWFCVG